MKLFQNRQNLVSTTGLLLILVLASVLRFYGLEIQSLWTDELWSLWFSSFENLAVLMREAIIPDTHPPAYQILLFWIVKLFGNSEWILRIPSAISGVLAVLGTFLVGKELYSNRTGLLAAAIMAVSWTPVYYSQEARSGMMMVCTTIFATYFWLKILTMLTGDIKIQTRIYAAYIFFAFLSAYTHYFALAYICLQGLLSVFFYFGNISKMRRIFFLYAGIILAYLPWLPFLYYQFNNSQSRINWITVPGLKDLYQFILFVFGYSQKFLIVSLVLVFLYLFTRKYEILRCNKYPISSFSLLLMWFFLPILITYGISITLKPLYVDRYLLFVLPTGYLILASSITEMNFPSKIKIILSVSLIGFLLYELIYSQGHYSRIFKEPFRTVAEYIVHSDKENSVVISNAMVPITLDYYFEKLGSDYKEELRVPGWDGTIYPEDEVKKIIFNRDTDYVWYVKQVINKQSDRELFDQLLNSLNLIQHEKFFDGNGKIWFELYLFGIPKKSVHNDQVTILSYTENLHTIG